MLFNGKSSNQTLPLGCITAFWFTFYNEMLTNLACVTLLYLLVHLSIVYLSNSCFFSIAFNQFLLLPIFLYPFKFLDVLFDAKFFSQATKDKLKLDEEYGRKINYIQKLMNSVRSLQQQVQDTEEQHARNTQVFFSVCYIHEQQQCDTIFTGSINIQYYICQYHCMQVWLQ